MTTTRASTSPDGTSTCWVHRRRSLEVELPAGNGVGTARAIARAYSAFAEGGDEPLAWGSADGLYIVWLLVELTQRGLADHADGATSPISRA